MNATFTRDSQGRLDPCGHFVSLDTPLSPKTAEKHRRIWWTVEKYFPLPHPSVTLFPCPRRSARRGSKSWRYSRDIERDAGRLFAEIGLDDIAAHEPESIETLTEYLDVDRIWIIADAGHDEPLGYAVVDIVDGHAHIEQISVRSNQGRRGLGATLLEFVCDWAADIGFAAVTLTTFGDVAWNAPFYAKHGFRVLSADETGSELGERRAEEAVSGLDPALRVCMRRDVQQP